MKKLIVIIFITILIIHKDVISAYKPDEIVLRRYDAEHKVINIYTFPLRIIDHPTLKQSVACDDLTKQHMEKCLQASGINPRSIIAVYVSHAYNWMFVDVNNDFGLRVIATFPGNECQLERCVNQRQAEIISNFVDRELQVFFDQSSKKFFFS